jgi:hypothetical protein
MYTLGETVVLVIMGAVAGVLAGAALVWRRAEGWRDTAMALRGPQRPAARPDDLSSPSYAPGAVRIRRLTLMAGQGQPDDGEPDDTEPDFDFDPDPELDAPGAPDWPPPAPEDAPAGLATGSGWETALERVDRLEAALCAASDDLLAELREDERAIDADLAAGWLRQTPWTRGPLEIMQEPGWAAAAAIAP